MSVTQLVSTIASAVLSNNGQDFEAYSKADLLRAEKKEAATLNDYYTKIKSDGLMCAINVRNRVGDYKYNFARILKSVKMDKGTALYRFAGRASMFIPPALLPRKSDNWVIRMEKEAFLLAKSDELKKATSGSDFMRRFLVPTSEFELRVMRVSVSRDYEDGDLGKLAAKLEGLVSKVSADPKQVDDIAGDRDELRALAIMHLNMAEKLKTGCGETGEAKYSGEDGAKYAKIGKLFVNLARLVRDPAAAKQAADAETAHDKYLSENFLSKPKKRAEGFMRMILTNWKRQMVVDHSVTLWDSMTRGGEALFSCYQDKTMAKDKEDLYLTYIANGNLDPLAFLLKISQSGALMCKYDLKVKPGGGGGQESCESQGKVKNRWTSSPRCVDDCPPRHYRRRGSLQCFKRTVIKKCPKGTTLKGGRCVKAGMRFNPWD